MKELIPSSQMHWGLGGGVARTPGALELAVSILRRRGKGGGALKVELGESSRSLRPEPLAPEDQGFPKLTGTQVGACHHCLQPLPGASLGPPPGAPCSG